MANKINCLQRIIMTLMLAVVLWGCGDSESFTIEGSIEGNPTMNLRFLYYTNGALNRGLTAARDGKFEFKGVAQTPAVLQILDNDYRPLGRLYISNGDRIECKLTRNNPNEIKVKGNEISERWARFLNDNAAVLASADANILIENYVKSNPADIVSTLLVLTSYDTSRDALKADSLMASIQPEVRPSSLVDGFNALLQRLVAQSVTEQVVPIPYFNVKDSLVYFNPSARPVSLIAMSDASAGRSDSIVPALKRMSAKKFRDKLQIIDFSMDRDTMAWHTSIRPDSANWRQGWVAGSVASPGIDRLGVPSLPYFVVVDSAGTQVMRTASISRAEACLDSCLSK